MKISNLIIFSLFIILIFGINHVSASIGIDDNVTLSQDNNAISIDEYENVKESYSNFLSDSVYESSKEHTINQKNYKMYFDDEGVLKSEYGGHTLIFYGVFENKGMFTINSSNTKITGKNTLFNNTVFNLKADGVMLTNLNFVLNKNFTQNHNAGIYVEGNNVTVYNVNLNYTAPNNVDVFGIYSNNNDGLNLINNTINYIGHAFNKGYNYVVVLIDSNNAWISGNNINATLPLREIDWSGSIYGGVWMDRVASFAAGYCLNLEFNNNNVYSAINYGEYADHKYPTLSSVLIYACNFAVIDGNNIKIEDYFTRKNTANYLYALDFYCLSNVTIINNNVDVFTYGGNFRYGTAYPIQVTGPAYNIRIAYNKLHSISNGPNIGIYSQNYFGSTQIDIINNFINITGKAGSDFWALVAGIEVQDSDDRILNNTIIVNTVGGYKIGDHIYGISYSQNTAGNHKYDIKYNHIKVQGPFAVSLNQGLSSITSDSKIMYNIFETSIGAGGDYAAIIGGNGHNNIIRYNTNGKDTIRHMSNKDLPNWLKKYLVDRKNKGNGVDLSWLNNNSNLGKGLGDGNGSENSFNRTGRGNGNNHIINNKINGNNKNQSKSVARTGDLNSTHYTYGQSGINIASASSSSGSGADLQSKSKAYEVSKETRPHNEFDYIKIIIVIIVVLILLFVGYRKKRK